MNLSSITLIKFYHNHTLIKYTYFNLNYLIFMVHIEAQHKFFKKSSSQSDSCNDGVFLLHVCVNASSNQRAEVKALPV